MRAARTTPRGGKRIWHLPCNVDGMTATECEELGIPTALELPSLPIALKAGLRFENQGQLHRPHLSVGIGFRCDTPIGLIRLDTGYRVPGLQAPAGTVDEGIPALTFGLPIAISFGIGEAF
jgi:hypothetical protein